MNAEAAGAVEADATEPTPLRVLIVDDEPLARLRLRGLVEANPQPRARVVGEVVGGDRVEVGRDRLHRTGDRRDGTVGGSGRHDLEGRVDLDGQVRASFGGSVDRWGRGRRQPTAPSICSSIRRLSSRAYSIGSSRAIGSTKPRTIMAIASSSPRPRLIR